MLHSSRSKKQRAAAAQQCSCMQMHQQLPIPGVYTAWLQLAACLEANEVTR